MASVLLFADDTKYTAETVLIHINAFLNLSRHDIRLFNPRGLLGNFSLNLDEFDAVILHWTLVCCSDVYLHPSFREKMRRFKGLKIQFIQDEYRWVNDITAAMRYMGIDILFSGTSPEARAKVYNGNIPGVKILDTEMGYVPLWERPAPDHPRPVDVGYRGRILPYWIGELGQQKLYIAQRFVEEAGKYDLACDIKWREEDRIYGPKWVDFLSSCKAVLGTESGSSITDFDRSIEGAVRAYLSEHPQAEFAEVSREVLAPHEGNIPVTTISTRIFEAAALNTGLILFPGEYKGYIKPWRNYIPLAKDFSNMGEIVAKLRDADFMRGMTDRTYADLVMSGKYSLGGFIKTVDRVLDCADHEPRPKWRYRLATIERPLWVPPSYAYWCARFWRDGSLGRMIKFFVRRWRR